MFDRSAEVYDAIYHWKDYPAEAQAIRELIRSRNPGAKTLLDVACGTGTHLALLADDFQCVGLDLNQDLLDIAKQKNPQMELVAGDMRTFGLGRQFDAITCLFGSTAYVANKEELTLTVQNFAKHLAPGGVLIVEPFVMRSKFQEGKFGIMTGEGPGFKVARANTTRREGDVCVLELHYLVARADKAECYRETHRVMLFEPDDYFEAIESAGLRPEYDEQGLMGRGLFLGVPL